MFIYNIILAFIRVYILSVLYLPDVEVHLYNSKQKGRVFTRCL